MMPNPKPLQPAGPFLGECAVVEADASGVKHADLLEPDGRMAWVGLDEREILVGKLPDVIGKLAVVEPEVRVGKVIQSGVQRPAS